MDAVVQLIGTLTSTPEGRLSLLAFGVVVVAVMALAVAYVALTRGGGRS